jgi:hypothetical protein
LGPQLGSGVDFVEVVGGIRFASILVGGPFGPVCGLAESGTAYCWGRAGVGLIGVPESNVPIEV